MIKNTSYLGNRMFSLFGWQNAVIFTSQQEKGYLKISHRFESSRMMLSIYKRHVRLERSVFCAQLKCPVLLFLEISFPVLVLQAALTVPLLCLRFSLLLLNLLEMLSLAAKCFESR